MILMLRFHIRPMFHRSSLSRIDAERNSRLAKSDDKSGGERLGPSRHTDKSGRDTHSLDVVRTNLTDCVPVRLQTLPN